MVLSARKAYEMLRIKEEKKAQHLRESLQLELSSNRDMKNLSQAEEDVHANRLTLEAKLDRIRKLDSTVIETESSLVSVAQKKKEIATKKKRESNNRLWKI